MILRRRVFLYFVNFEIRRYIKIIMSWIVVVVWLLILYTGIEIFRMRVSYREGNFRGSKKFCVISIVRGIRYDVGRKYVDVDINGLEIKWKL